MLSQKESIAISYIRVLAMISIVLCHVFMCLRLKYNDDFRYLSLSLNVGVQVFLCISGFLYGKKDVADWNKWFKQRFHKIFVPYLILVICVVLLDIILGNVHSLGCYVEYGVGLSGFAWAGGPGWIHSLLAHTWFITAICLAYLITPILQILKRKAEIRPAFAFILLLIVLIIGYGGGYFFDVKVVRIISSWILLYSFSYFYACITPTIQKWIRIALLAFFVLSLSLLSKNDFHEIFESCVYQITHDIGGLVILTFGIVLLRNIAKNLPKPIKLLDDYSFSIYLVHYPILIICFGWFYPNLWISILVSLIGLVFSVFIFDYLIRKVNNIINNIKF